MVVVFVVAVVFVIDAGVAVVVAVAVVATSSFPCEDFGFVLGIRKLKRYGMKT